MTDRIIVAGHNLVEELMGQVDFVDVAYLQLAGDLPTNAQRRMLNSLLVCISDHGLTPSVLAARLTHFGSPEAMQNGVAAGLLGAGSVILGAMQNVAELVGMAVRSQRLDIGSDLRTTATAIVNDFAGRNQRVPGIGHPIHIDGDPRTPKLMAIAAETGFYGVHCKLAEAIAEAAEARTKRFLPLNAAGAMGAIVAEMGFPPLAARGIALIARTAGLVAHILQEEITPMARDVWATFDRSVQPMHSEPQSLARK